MKNFLHYFRTFTLQLLKLLTHVEPTILTIDKMIRKLESSVEATEMFLSRM